jgi:rod shape-determining protein MreD
MIQKIWIVLQRNSLFPGLALLATLMAPALHLGRLNLLYSVLFFWLLTNPPCISFGLVFMLSVLQDILYHTYLGTHCSLYALFMLFIMSQRRQLFNRSFLLIWAAFSVSLFALMALKSFLGFVLYQQTVTLFEFFMEVLLPILLFPVVFQGCISLYTRAFSTHAQFF